MTKSRSQGGDYIQSLEYIGTIRKAERDDELTDLEQSEYRKVTGKLSWLANSTSNSTRPDLSFTVLRMSTKNNSATIADLRYVNRVLEKARERESCLRFSRIGRKEDLIVVGIGNASFKSDEKAVGGVMLFITNSRMTRAAPIYWKSKQIERVCHSSKDAETLNMCKMVDDATYAARQLEVLLYGDYRGRVPVRLFTDSEST